MGQMRLHTKSQDKNRGLKIIRAVQHMHTIKYKGGDIRVFYSFIIGHCLVLCFMQNHVDQLTSEI